MTNRTRIALLLAMMMPAAFVCCQSYEITEKECAEECGTDQKCCGGVCVDTRFDPFNCGTCGDVCSGADGICVTGGCKNKLNCTATCNVEEGRSCCGTQCCASGEVCCYDEDNYRCVDIEEGICPP